MTNKVMTWVLIMALLVSQSYAYAFVPCESNAHASSQHNNAMASKSLDPQSLDPQSLDPQSLDPIKQSMLESDMPSHMQHNMEQSSQQPKVAMDCCDKECSCLTGACASVTLSHFISDTALTVVSDSAGFYLFSIPDAFLPSLRKPPIFS
jgi:hypothetical protein